MKTIIATFLALATAAHAQWLTSVPQALEQATRENKVVLLDFTGSDWCGWCKKLDADTLSKPEFLQFAAAHAVLVKVDFPRHTEQPDALKQANGALQQKYKVSGFPTLVALSANGTELWKKVGYLPGGPAALIAQFSKTDSPSPAAAPPQPVAETMPNYPAPPPRQPGEQPHLQGILFSSAHRLALFDGKNCEEGDTIHGLRVLKITRTTVTVEWKGQKQELSLN